MNSSISTSKPDTKPIYGSLIEVPEKSYKAFLFTFLIGVFIILFGTESIHRMDPFNRHELDMQMTDLSKLRGEQYDLLIMGDSVTRTPLWGVEVSDSVYMLSTSATVNPLGNELIARRFFDQKNKTDEVAFFLSPILLRDSFKSKYFPTHFESIFTKTREQNLVTKRLGYDPYTQTGKLNRRLKSLNAFYHGLPQVQRSERKVVAKTLLTPPFNQQSNGRSDKRLKALRAVKNDNPFGVTDQNIEFFKNYVDYVQEQGAKVTIIIPPMMENTSQLFLSGKVEKMIRTLEDEKGAKIINVNSSQTYPPDAFWDGTHLNPFWQDIFIHQLEELVGPVLKKESVVGISKLTPPVTFGLAEFNYRSGKEVSKKNEVGLISNQVDIPFHVPKSDHYCLSARVLAPDEYSNSFHLSINFAKSKVWHLTETSPEWQWARYSDPIKFPAGLNLIRLGKRENTPLSAVKLEKCEASLP